MLRRGLRRDDARAEVRRGADAAEQHGREEQRAAERGDDPAHGGRRGQGAKSETANYHSDDRTFDLGSRWVWRRHFQLQM